MNNSRNEFNKSGNNGNTDSNVKKFTKDYKDNTPKESSKRKNKEKKKKKKNIELLPFINNYEINDEILNYIVLKTRIKKFYFCRTFGYKINNGFYAFLKKDLNHNLLFNIYKVFLNPLEKIKSKTTIFEIPTINNIINLTLFSQNLILCAGKIIFDEDDNNSREENFDYNETYYNTKYYKKDAIILVFNDNKKNIYNIFENNYEINHICIIYKYSQNESISDSCYFLIVGFEGRNQIIKLFKIYSEESQIKMEFKNDIKLGIEEEIISIKQLSNEILLISCANDIKYLYPFNDIIIH